ncbi:MAG: hotdog fold thioesterase [Lacibacter sp.]
MPTPAEIANSMMLKDAFSNWLGVEIIDIKDGYCKVKMTVREEMTNGVGLVHGGILFSLADSALGFASNSRNKQSVSLDTSISFIKTASPGNILVAEATELYNGNSTGHYLVSIVNQNNQLIAQLKGCCYRTGKLTE